MKEENVSQFEERPPDRAIEFVMDQPNHEFTSRHELTRRKTYLSYSSYSFQLIVLVSYLDSRNVNGTWGVYFHPTLK